MGHEQLYAKLNRWFTLLQLLAVWCTKLWTAIFRKLSQLQLNDTRVEIEIKEHDQQPCLFGGNFKTKGNTERRVPIRGDAEEALVQMHEPGTSGPVFTDRDG